VSPTLIPFSRAWEKGQGMRDPDPLLAWRMTAASCLRLALTRYFGDDILTFTELKGAMDRILRKAQT